MYQCQNPRERNNQGIVLTPEGETPSGTQTHTENTIKTQQKNERKYHLFQHLKNRRIKLTSDVKQDWLNPDSKHDISNHKQISLKVRRF